MPVSLLTVPTVFMFVVSVMLLLLYGIVRACCLWYR